MTRAKIAPRFMHLRMPIYARVHRFSAMLADFHRAGRGVGMLRYAYRCRSHRFGTKTLVPLSRVRRNDDKRTANHFLRKLAGSRRSALPRIQRTRNFGN